jgi:hypothetical protein
MPEPNEWRSFHQNLPLPLYEQWKVQLRRVAQANGIAPDIWEADSKLAESVGPRVQVIEILTILLARSDNEAFRV